MSLRWADQQGGSTADDGPPSVSDVDMSDDDDGHSSPVYLKRWGGFSADKIESIEPMVRVEKEPLYSAHLGDRHADRYSSTDSLETDLSLLSCSSVDAVSSAHKKKRRKSKIGKLEEYVDLEENKTKTNWADVAKRHNNVLEAMMMKDAAVMAPVGGDEGGVWNIRRAMDVMNEVEKRMLFNCSLTTGLHGLTKSRSTTNVNEAIEIIRNKPAQRIKKSKTHSARPEHLGHVSPQKPVSAPKIQRRGSMYGYGHGMILPEAERLPDRIPDDFSLSSTPLPVMSLSRPSTRQTTAGTTRRSGHSPFIMPERKVVSAKTVFRNFSRMDATMRRKILDTLARLDNITGYGDAPDVPIKNMKDPADLFPHIEADFAKLPKMPQRVRVAPQLSTVIKDEIRQRIGKPREVEIKQNHVEKFNQTTKKLSERTQRNLMIFNWLQNLDEDHFEHVEELERTQSMAMAY